MDVNDKLLAEYPDVCAMLADEHIERLQKLPPQLLHAKLEMYKKWMKIGGVIRWTINGQTKN